MKIDNHEQSRAYLAWLRRLSFDIYCTFQISIVHTTKLHMEKNELVCQSIPR